MTHEEKFKLLIKNDPLLKKECKFLIEKWQVSPFFKKGLDFKNTPIEYKKDLNFVIHEIKLPTRFTNFLHNYLQTRKIPKWSYNRDKIRVFINHDPRYNSGQIILKMDIDARLSDVKKEWRSIAKAQRLLNKMIGGPKISQPIRKPERLTRLIKKESPTSIAFDTRDWTKKDDKKERSREMNALRVMKFRIKNKNTTINRSSVRNRKRIEEYYNNQEIPF
jgi:hypothetical protein